MLEIIVNNVSLELKPEIARFQKEFGLFDDGIFQGDWSFPISIANSGANLIALEYVSEVNAHLRKARFACIVKHNGNQFINGGTLVVTNFAPIGIKATIKFGVAALPVMERNIADIDLGGDVYLSALSTYIGNDWNNKICFPPFFAPNWYDGKNADFYGVVNNFNVTTGNYWTNTSTNNYCLAPMVYVFYLLQQIFKVDGYTCKGNFWDDEDMQGLTVYSNRTLDAVALLNLSDVRLHTNQIFNYSASGFIKLQPTFVSYPDLDDDTRWNNTNFEYTIATAGDHTIDLRLLTKLNDGFYLANSGGSVELFLDAASVAARIFNVAADVHYNFSYTATSGDVGKKLSIKIWMPITDGVNACYPDFVALKDSNLVITNVASTATNVFKTYVNLAQHVPDWTCGDLVGALREWAKLRITKDDVAKVVYFEYINDVLTATPIDVTDRITTPLEFTLEEFNGKRINYTFGDTDALVDGGVKTIPANNFIGVFNNLSSKPTASKPGLFFLNEGTNIIYVSDNNLAWVPYGNHYGELLVGSGLNADEVQLALAPMFMCEQNLNGGFLAEHHVIMPYTKEICSSEMFDMGDNSTTPRFLFYRGLTTNYGSSSLPRSYPLASSSNIDIRGGAIGKYSFALIGERSVFAQYCLNLYNLLLNGEMAECGALPTETDISNLDNWKTLHIDFANYVAKNISIVFDKGVAKLQLYLYKN